MTPDERQKLRECEERIQRAIPHLRKCAFECAEATDEELRPLVRMLFEDEETFEAAWTLFAVYLAEARATLN